MSWLALSPGAVAAVWAGLAAAALWLYLHHRRPQHRKVSTLRFWVSVQSVSQPRRRKLREPWAFLAQALFLLLLVLALANIRWGFAIEGRSVVIVFDTSVWSQARPSGGTPIIDREREEAERLLDSLPASDRVLLLRNDPDAPPILPFTTDRVALRRALSAVQPSGGATDLPSALEIGRAALAGSRQGLLVYVGPGLLDEQQEHSLDEFRAKISGRSPMELNPVGTSVYNGNEPQFLVRLVGDGAPTQNRGITHISLRRDAAQPNRWHLLTQLKNYGNTKADVTLKFSIDDEALGKRTVALSPNELVSVENEFTWDKGGLLQVEMSPPDELEADNRAIVNVPAFRIVQVSLFTDENSPFASDLLPVLSSNPYVVAQVVPPKNVLEGSPDVAIYQETALPSQFAFNSILFLSGPSSPAGSPRRITQWNPQHPVTRWVRTRDVGVRNPATLNVLPGDSVLAYTEGSPPTPLILAREQNGHRLLIVGFNPHDSNFLLESAFPLLMAGGLEWMTHSVDEVADSLSTGELDLPGPVTRIVSPSGKDVPFARNGGEVHLLALETGMYRMIGPNGETAIAVNTPLLPANRLTVTAAEAAGVDSEPLQPERLDLWRWLVILAIVALWLEWWLYYSSRERLRTAEIREAPGDEPLQNVDGDRQEQQESEFPKPNYVAR